MKTEILAEDLGRIKELLERTVGKSDYTEIQRMGGLTNRTYQVDFADGHYVVRIPGAGTEELIVRSDEKISTKLACKLEIDAELLYFGDDGSKVTKLIPNAVTMSAKLLCEEHHIVMAADIFRKLHGCGEDTGVPFEVFDMAGGYERIISENNVKMYDDYQDIKDSVMKVKAEIDGMCDIKKVPCHNDPLCENWVMSGKDRMYLIDWEYAGMNDGIWDLADISIEASFDYDQDMLLLTKYLDREPSKSDWKHFLANKLYVDYLWTLWAKTRVPYDGQPMEDWASERYERLKCNLEKFYNA